jgi:hypothetical protein
MAFSISKQQVLTGAPVGNVDSSGNVETRGAMVMGKIDVTSYTNGGEVVPAGAFGLNEVYGVVFNGAESDTYAVRSFEIAAGNKSGTLNVDSAGSGTEVSSTTDIGEFHFMAWGEMLGSGSN